MRGALAHRDRPGPGAAAREADRRAVGRVDGRLPGRRVPAAVGGVERPVPRHDPRLLARPLRRHPRPSRPGWPAPRTCTPTTAARRTPRSTSSPRTTASRCATWCPTTTSTTRPTARTTATAPTTTGPGTTASRARPTTRTILALRRRQAANLMATLCLSTGVPMITAGDERGRTQRGNNNAYVPGQRDLVGRLAARRRVARRLRDHQDRAAAAPRAPGAAAAALLRGPADDRGRPEGPGLDAPRRAAR